jgi:hypothetical protein
MGGEMRDANTTVRTFSASRLVSHNDVALRIPYAMLQIRYQLAECLPNCNACVTYAYFYEAVNPLIDTRRRVADPAELTMIEDLSITCLAQCITEDTD